MQSLGMSWGALMVYVWIGFLLEMKLYGNRARTGHIILDAVVLVIFAFALLRTLSQIKLARAINVSRSPQLY